MNIYVFGNEYVAADKRALEVARELEDTIEGISFVFVKPNEDVPFVNERHVVILDTVQGIQDVALVEGDDLLPGNGSGYYESPKARDGQKEDSR